MAGGHPGRSGHPWPHMPPSHLHAGLKGSSVSLGTGPGTRPAQALPREGGQRRAPACCGNPPASTAVDEPRLPVWGLLYDSHISQAPGSPPGRKQHIPLGAVGDESRRVGWQEEAIKGLPRSWPDNNRRQAPGEVGKGPSWKYQGPSQLKATTLPSRGGSIARGLAGSGRAGP